jgi:hypothetical protein
VPTRDLAERYVGRLCERHPGSPRYRSGDDCVKCAYERRAKQKAGQSESQREKWARYGAAKKRESDTEYKNAVINVLTNGEGTCRWCGQGDQDVLTIDHIDNNGKEHRRTVRGGASICRWIVANDYPPGFQVLCFNCNVKKEVLRRRSLCK